MALESILFEQNPISHASEDYTSNNMFISLENFFNFTGTLDESPIACSKYPPLLVNEFDHSNNSPNSLEGSQNEGFFNFDPPRGESPPCSHRKKRRTTKTTVKNKEKIENQRMNHITIERNRRKQVNHYLATLRSMMPSSYAQRGDQASIVGGAINFVKELEHQLQLLEAHKHGKLETENCCPSHVFNDFFTFPQYSTCPTRFINSNNLAMTEQISNVANIEVANLIDNHANIKVLSGKQPKQLYKILTSFFSLSLTIHHLNVTTFNDMVLYSINVKVEDDCELTTVHEIATAVHEIMGMIQKEADVFA